MKKIIYTVLLVFVMLFALAVSSYAAEYTVANNDQYASAYEQATNGDTIVVAEKLTCDIYANKSITYVLKADWESARLVLSQSDVEVSFIADGGDYKIMPTNYSTTDGWLNISQAYTNVVINFGGKNGGTVTIDGTNATHDRVSYVTASANVVLNLLNGSAIANFNNETKDDDISACIIYAHTVNMYDGCKIYGNNVISAPLIKTTYFNMFGGEIFGNLLTSTRFQMRAVGAIYADKQFTMYGGNIYDNVIKATHDSNYNFNVAGFITTDYGYRNGKVVIYNGEIGNLYAFGNKGNNCTSLFGIAWRENPKSYFYYNTGIETGKQYQFTDEPAFAYDQDTGKTIWQVENATVINENYYGYCWDHNRQAGNKGAIFLNAQKKNIAGKAFDTYTVINAYIDGVYAYSGSNTIAIPSGYEAWSSTLDGYCHTGRALSVSDIDSSAPVTYYASYTNPVVTENLVTFCSICSKVLLCENAEHGELVYITYEDYSKEGVKATSCAACGVAETESVPAIFSCPGFANPENGNNGIAVGYTINLKALAEFKAVNGSALNFGVMIVNPDYLDGKNLFMVDGVINTSGGSIQVDMSDSEYSNVSVTVNGFTGKAENLSLVIALYAYADGGEIAYVQSKTTKCASAKVTKDDGVLYTVTYKSVLNANTSVSDLDEYIVPKKEQEE